MLDATPLHLRDARSKGIPSMGAGAIYPFTVDSIRINPIPLPPHFRRGFSLDDGWKVTAVGFYAYDPDHDILYKTAELYERESRPEQTASEDPDARRMDAGNRRRRSPHARRRPGD
jgi:hypothetical protein